MDCNWDAYPFHRLIDILIWDTNRESKRVKKDLRSYAANALIAELPTPNLPRGLIPKRRRHLQPCRL
jgi:hypothetical protein